MVVKSMNDFFRNVSKRNAKKFLLANCCQNRFLKSETLEISFELKGENSWGFFNDCLGK